MIIPVEVCRLCAVAVRVKRKTRNQLLLVCRQRNRFLSVPFGDYRITLGSAFDSFKLSLLQWMEAGVLGAFGLPVTNSVVEGSENALVPVQTHHPLVVGKAVARTITSPRSVL